METYGNRERSILRRFFVNENEDQAIRRKMGEAGIRNFSTFARYMLLTGRVQVINFEELSKRAPLVQFESGVYNALYQD